MKKKSFTNLSFKVISKIGLKIRLFMNSRLFFYGFKVFDGTFLYFNQKFLTWHKILPA